MRCCAGEEEEMQFEKGDEEFRGLHSEYEDKYVPAVQRRERLNGPPFRSHYPHRPKQQSTL